MSYLGARNGIALGVQYNVTLGGQPLLFKLTPSLILQFAGAQTMDPRITFTRSTTATFTGSDGLIQTAAIDAPRFDYNPTTLAPLGLLIEEQRTNLVTYSEQFSDAVWVKTRASITADAAVSPDGTMNADKLVEDTTASNTHQIGQSVSSFTSGTAYTFTTYMKADERGWGVLRFPASAFTTALQAFFNLSTGALGVFSAGVTSSITPVGNNWYRCSITATATATASGNVLILPSATNSTAIYTGDGTSGIFIWGAQTEAGDFPTSYIPTVASQVTRAADIAVMTGTNFSSWYNAVEGTLFANYSAFASGTRTMAAINDNTANESIRLRTISTNPFFTVTDGGVDQADIDAGTVASNIVYKFAGAYAANDFAASIAGGAAVTDTSGSIPTVDRMMIGNSAATNALNGHIRQIVYYPRRLSNADLQGITA
jgi:hypothetical protein